MLEPKALAGHYNAFLSAGRVLLTGHSHQAWPDVARDGVIAAFDDAALHVDAKWSRAFEKAECVRGVVADALGRDARDIALASNTHELVARFLSALDLGARPHLVTTSGEFHSISRQLRRLAEAHVEVTVVPADPVDTLAERLSEAIRDTTAAVLASTVLFQTSALVPGLEAVGRAARAHGAQVLLDAYHQFGVRPFELSQIGADSFVVGGGYKYAQWGEGCCWMAVPPDCTLRPVYTGWFAEFGELAVQSDPALVGYGRGGALRFAGSTYDPTSHYRAAAVIEFFAAHGLTAQALQTRYAEQTERLRAALFDVPLLSPEDPANRGGFVAFKVQDAGRVVDRLRDVGVYVDARGDALRLGPAPYLTQADLDRAAGEVRAVLGLVC